MPFWKVLQFFQESEKLQSQHILEISSSLGVNKYIHQEKITPKGCRVPHCPLPLLMVQRSTAHFRSVYYKIMKMITVISGL